MVADFDARREQAAQAIFHLGETYRKLGRIEQARVQFARILREFVDFPELARLSQQQLNQHTSGGNWPVPAGQPSAAATAEERALLSEELALLTQQFERTRELVKTGATSEGALFPLQRDMLHIKQQLARLARDEKPSRDPAPAPAPTTAPVR
jgi:hypothetical protein